MACLVVRGNVSIVLPRWQAQRVGGEYFSSLLAFYGLDYFGDVGTEGFGRFQVVAGSRLVVGFSPLWKAIFIDFSQSGVR